MQPGDLLAGRFLLERRAATGGMATVFRATDVHAGRAVAVKVVDGLEGPLADRFSREARVLADVEHPGIVRYVAHGSHERGLYLAMEWLEGESLEERLSRGALAVVDAVALAERVAEALGHAHARGVVHRDVKPSNVVLRGGALDRPTLIDFGVARISDDVARTHSGITLGTPGYMAPEQARGAHDVDARADVFALGCVLFECLAGRPAFSGEHVMAVLAKILLEDAARLRDVRDDVPPELDELCARMLAKDPAARPENGAAVARELARIAEVTTRTSAVPALRSVPALGRREQRVACVLVAGEARLGKRVEVTDATTRAETRKMRDEVIRALGPGAEVETLAEGAIVATLTGAGSAIDRVAWAATCALDVHAALPRVPMVLATGRSVVEARRPIGEALDRAAAILRRESVRGLARPAKGAAVLRIDDVTAGLLDARFVVDGDDAGLFLSAKRGGLDAARLVNGRPTPFVGRERDLSDLLARIDASLREKKARALLVTGPPGGGKSRLAFELAAALRARRPAVTTWSAQADATSRASPFALLGRLVCRTAGIAEGETDDVRRRKLLARVARNVPENEARPLASFLGEMISVRFPPADAEHRAALADPVLLGDRMRRAWEDWLAAECDGEPLVVILDDLEWADASSVSFLEAAIRGVGARPLVFALFARPEVIEAYPQLRNVVERIELAPLPATAAEKIVRAALEGRVTAEQTRAIVERAAGNAFFLEELVRQAASGSIDRLPDTVIAVVQARLASLPSDTRRVLRASSVFGTTFWAGGVKALVGGSLVDSDVERHVAELVRRELIVAREPSRIAGEAEYAFVDATVHETAYDMLTPDDRELGHRLAAAWLERVGERDASVLVEHLARGREGERAVVWCARAASEALGGNDFDGAIAWAERGATWGEGGPHAGELDLVRAEAHRWRGEQGKAEKLARRALDRLPKGTPLWLRAAGEAASASGRSGRADAASEIAGRLPEHPEPGAEAAFLVAVARTAIHLFSLGRAATAESLLARATEVESQLAEPPPDALAWVLRARAVRAAFGRFPAAHVTLLQSAVAAFERAGDMRNACTQRMNVGAAYMDLGANAQAELALVDAIAQARRMHLHDVVALAKRHLGVVLVRRAAIADAKATEREAVAAFGAKRNKRLEAIARTNLAIVLAAEGDRDGAAREAQRAVDALDPHMPARAHALAVLARVLVGAGDVAKALAAATRAKELLDELGGADEGEATIRLAWAEALHASGDDVRAAEAIREAEGRILAIAARIGDPALRHGFVRAVPENARTLELAKLWLGRLSLA